jgi:hypothetical protein
MGNAGSFQKQIPDAVIIEADRRIKSGESASAVATDLGVSRVTLWRRIKALPAAVEPQKPAGNRKHGSTPPGRPRSRPESPSLGRSGENPARTVTQPAASPRTAEGGRVGWPRSTPRARTFEDEHDGRVRVTDGVRTYRVDPSRAEKYRALGWRVTA